MTHPVRFPVIAILVALALCVPVQAQTPEIDALRVRAEAGNAEAQYDLGVMYANGLGVPEDDAAAAPPRIFVNRCAPGSPGWPTALGDQPPDRNSAADPSGSVLRLCAGAVSMTQQL